MSNTIWKNGELKSDSDNHIHHTDSGFTTGIGVFDSLLCIDGVVQYGQDHYERLIHDSEIIIGKTPNDFSYEVFTETISKLLKENNLEKGYARVRTTVTGGIVDAPLAMPQDLNILMIAGETKEPKEIAPKTAKVINEYPRIAGCELENCKRLDYTRSFSARRKAQEQGADEAIITNTNGNISCGATSNIFIEENGVLITPPLSEGVLAGVTRKNIIKDRHVIEEIISIERLKNADKAYLSNSFFGLCLITLI